MKTILVPVDFSASSAVVCNAARSLGRSINGRLLLLHVVQPPSAVMNEYYAFDGGQLAAAITAGEKFSDQKLAELAQQLRGEGMPTETSRVTGLPVPSIIEAARSAKAEFIVMGSHGHGALYDLFVGSTTQGVLKKAPCPVLVVPSAPAKSVPAQ